MKYRQFGDTGFSVSEVTLGTMRLTADAAHVPKQLKTGGLAARKANEEGRRVLDAALDAGVNSFHSSEDYGTWWLFGDALKKTKRREEIHHTIKLTTPDYLESAFDPAAVRSAVERALRSLNAERITFVQHLQRGPNVSPIEAYSSSGDGRRIQFLRDNQGRMAQTFESLRREGKIGAVLSFPHTVGYLEEAVLSRQYRGVVHFLNLLETEIVPHLKLLSHYSMGFFALRPLLQGMLTDRRADRANLPNWDPVTLPIWDSRYAVLQEVLEVLRTQEGSLSATAVRFSLSFPEVTSVVASARTMSQLDDLLVASEAPHFSAELLQDIRDATTAADRFSKFDLFPENQFT